MGKNIVYLEAVCGVDGPVREEEVESVVREVRASEARNLSISESQCISSASTNKVGKQSEKEMEKISIA